MYEADVLDSLYFFFFYFSNLRAFWGHIHSFVYRHLQIVIVGKVHTSTEKNLQNNKICHAGWNPLVWLDDS